MILGEASQVIGRSHMKANPGGVIDPRNVYGRDGLIAELWQRLDQLCVLMNAERRIGKTSVLRKMASDGAPGWCPILLDLEKFHSAEEFAVGVYEQVQGYLGIWKKPRMPLARFTRNTSSSISSEQAAVAHGKRY
jgi:hypothetical protein